MAYFFSTPVDIDIVLDDTSDRQMVDVKLDKNRREKAPLYMDGESVKGAVTVRPKDGKRLEHTGIKVQFIGTIGRSPPSTSFVLECLCEMENNDGAGGHQREKEGRLGQEKGVRIGRRRAQADDVQRCSSIAAIIMNSSPSAKSSPPQAIFNTPKPTPSTSNPWKSNMSPTTASM